MKAKIGDMVKFRKGKTIATGKIVAEDENSIGKYFVIKMTGKFKGSGHTCEGIYDTCDYWHAYESMIVSVEPCEEIHITRDGDTVHAIMKKDGKVTYRAKAVCSPEDKFNFLVGASMAYARLIESAVEINDPPEYVEIISKNGKYIFSAGEICKVDSFNTHSEEYLLERVSDGLMQCVRKNDTLPINAVSRTAKSGEYIMIRKGKEFYKHDKSGCAMKVESSDETYACVSKNPEIDAGYWDYPHDRYVVLEGYQPQKRFIPHLEDKDSGKHYGIIGSETPLKEATGKKLYVGDLVAAIRLKDGKIFNDQEFVVCSNTVNGKKAFVMGIASCCTKTGEIEKFIVVKQKSYKDLYNGQIAGYIKAVLEE